MIWIYDHGKLALICGSKDWRIFLPGVRDEALRWVGNPWIEGQRWTWRWAPA